MRFHFAYLLLCLTLGMFVVPFWQILQGQQLKWNALFGGPYALALPGYIAMSAYFVIVGATMVLSIRASVIHFCRDIRNSR